jgi:hypothetical protein
MRVNEIIRDVMANTVGPDGKKITQTAMVEHINEKFDQKVTPAALSDRLKTYNMRINTVIEMLDLLGYEVAIRPKNDKRQTYVVERGEGRNVK